MESVFIMVSLLAAAIPSPAQLRHQVMYKCIKRRDPLAAEELTRTGQRGPLVRRLTRNRCIDDGMDAVGVGINEGSSLWMLP
jgi:hypothetical protein